MQIDLIYARRFKVLSKTLLTRIGYVRGQQETIVLSAVPQSRLYRIIPAYLCAATCGDNVRICRDPRCLLHMPPSGADARLTYAAERARCSSPVV